ncbi:hypothetical protein LCM4576_22440 [Mesorhizobium sp. LCM 4576]|nr:hypothetical protein LCM4576_22440 [Mesorhizobium sp. LCM 4576]
MRIPVDKAVHAFEGKFSALHQPMFDTIGAEQLDPLHVDNGCATAQAAVGAQNAADILGGGRDIGLGLHGDPITSTDPA